MSKYILDYGFLVYNDWKHPVISLNVNRAPTKIDAGDTGENFDLMAGRNTWLFTATILLDSSRDTIGTDYSESEIVLAFNQDVYVGQGYIFAVSEQANLDDKIVVTVSGQFKDNAYYCLCGPNGLYWHDPSSGLADGWTFTNTGGYTFSQESDTKMKIRQVCELTGTSIILRYLMTMDETDDYLFFIKYQTRNLSNAHYRFQSSGSVGTILNDSYPTDYTSLYAVRTALAADSRIEFEWDYGGDPNWFRIYLCVLGKIIDSIT